MTNYMKAADRRETILKIGCDMAEKTHYKDIRLEGLAEKCGTVKGNILRLMGSIENIRKSVIDHALKNRRDVILAQAIIDKHPSVSDIDLVRRGEILMSMV